MWDVIGAYERMNRIYRMYIESLPAPLSAAGPGAARTCSPQLACFPSRRFWKRCPFTLPPG